MIDKDELLAISDDRLRRMATYASVTVAAILIVAKLAAYFLTDSVAMLSSLLDSTIDLLSSLVTVYGVANALRPPDQNHRFGHGKAEPLTALAQAAFITGSSILLGYEALNRLYHPHEIENETFGYVVMGIAIVMTIILIRFQHYVIHRTSSLAIDADRMHYLGDLGVNLAVMVAFAMYQLMGVSWLDPIFAIAIASGLVFGATRIASKALRVLMDEELPEEDREKIRKIVLSVPSILGVHDMRTRSDSDRIFIELHVELDADMKLRAAHDVADKIVEAIHEQYPEADILIHEDPAGVQEPRLDAQITAYAKEQHQG